MSTCCLPHSFEPPIGRLVPVHVSFLAPDCSLFVQLQDSEAQFASMQRELQATLESEGDDDDTELFPSGALVAAKHLDGVWYRGIVLWQSASRSVVQVRYLDYGETAKLHVAGCIRPLPRKFAKQPPAFAICCRLSDVHSAEPDSPETIDRLQKLFIEWNPDVGIFGPKTHEQDFYTIRLFRDISTIIESDFTSNDDSSLKTLSPVVASCGPALSPVVPVCDPFPPDQCENPNSSFDEFELPATPEKINTVTGSRPQESQVPLPVLNDNVADGIDAESFDLNIADSRNTGDDSVDTIQERSMQTALKSLDLDPQSPFVPSSGPFERSRLPVDSNERVRVSIGACVNADNFHVIKEEDADELRAVTRACHQLTHDAKPPQLHRPIQTGTKCAIWEEFRNLFVRAEVIADRGKRFVTVLVVDSGQRTEVPVQWVYELVPDPKLHRTPAFAIPCMISGTQARELKLANATDRDWIKTQLSKYDISRSTAIADKYLVSLTAKKAKSSRAQS